MIRELQIVNRHILSYSMLLVIKELEATWEKRDLVN